jgi:hypothetical protein
MNSIYENAVLTIVAATDRDGNAGFQVLVNTPGQSASLVHERHHHSIFLRDNTKHNLGCSKLTVKHQ